MRTGGIPCRALGLVMATPIVSILNLAAADCTAAANADINFANYPGGINLMFNGELDGYAWGGSQYMTLDGVSKLWPITWEPPWGYSNIAVIAHEMGHAFGLPHSSGAYGQTYDNQWDIMSDTWSNCFRSTDITYGCLGQHTIAAHKDLLGWIPAGAKIHSRAKHQYDDHAGTIVPARKQ